MGKILVLCILTSALTGCVSQSHSMRDGGWSYADSRAYSMAPAYYGAAWYPWWSVDYFYLGRPIGRFSGYPYYDPYFFPGFYAGWYAPYPFYDPWYRYYDPWFSGYYYGWRPGFRHYDPYFRRPHEPPDDPVMLPDPPEGQGPRRGRTREDERLGRSGQGLRESPPMVRNISIAPSQNAADRGMVIVNRADAKPAEIRIPPVRAEDSQQPQVSVQGPPRTSANSARLPSRPPVMPSAFPDAGPSAGPPVRYSPPAVSSGRQKRSDRERR